MNSCNYYFKNKYIGNIIDLDTFLLEKQQYYSTLGDMVFSHSLPQLDSITKLDEAFKASEDIRIRTNIMRSFYIDGEELIEYKLPSIGVSLFLKGQRNSAGELYFPEFIPEEYWSRRFMKWAIGEFTDDEISVFFKGNSNKVTSVELGNVSDWRNTDGSFKEVFGTDEQKRLRALMEDKWKHQSEYGTEVHNVLQQYFSKTKGKNPVFRYTLWEDPAKLQASLDYMKNQGLISESLYNSTEKINQILEYAKTLREKIETTYGTDVEYYPEFTLTANLNKEYLGRTDLKILGRLDLLVVDGKGTPHIIDYKTSPKSYSDYSKAKKLGFTYLLATYERMLRRWGLNTTKTDIMIAPIILDNFHQELGNWTYDGVKEGSSSLLESLNLEVNKDYVRNNLDEYIEAPLVIDGTSNNIINKVTKAFNTWFPKYGDARKKTDEDIKDLINSQNGFELNPKTGNYEYLPKNKTKPITATEKEGEEGLFRKVKNYYIGNKELAVKNTQNIIKALQKAQEQNSHLLEIPGSMDDWVKIKLSKYCSNDWTVRTDAAADAALQYGMILLYNPTLDLMEVVKISSNHVKDENVWGPNRTNITGGLEEDDSVENSKSDSLILKGVNGNIELMESMLVLNNLSFNKSINLGSIQIISPFYEAEGLTASNKELLYNWDKLNALKTIEDTDKFHNGDIHLLNKAEVCYNEFMGVLNRIEPTGYNKKYEDLKPAVSALSTALVPNNKEEILRHLNELRNKLESDSFNMRKDLNKEGESVHKNIRNYDEQYEYTLYQMVSAAILELNNFDVRQALEDHDNWVLSFYVLTKGLSGNYQDNAGNFGNAMLNLVTSLVLEGYQNGRDTALRKLIELSEKVKLLKKDLNYGFLLEHTIGNQTSLYDGMTEYTADGDLMFINPWKTDKLSEPKKEFLKYVILTINKNVHPDYTDMEINDKIQQNDIDFFRVPLVDSSFASKLHTEGWLNWFKNKCKIFSSRKNFKAALDRQATAFFNIEEEKKHNLDSVIFETVNLMDLGRSPDRLNIIKNNIIEKGEGCFERDLETILSKHIWAYAVQDAMENRMPLLKAAYISLAVMGNDLNYSFKNDELFFKEFVLNRINHLSLTKHTTAKGILNTMLLASSWMALAFSPVLFSYQAVEGIWKGIKLVITKPDGTLAFTAKNMHKSAKVVYKELFNYSDNPTVTSSVNAFYGINDMDNAAFAENNTTNKHGIFNFFTKFAFKFSSRPDFYNRMTIFVALMMNDGCWEAHSIDPKTKQLKYDWKKDKRFKAYAENSSNKEEYNKAKALYYATALLLVREGARNEDGSLFTIGDKVPLPKAYSNKEAEAKKAVGDITYGYYDSTKKSLMQSTLLGGLFMLMRTYWSAKKNLYLAPGGIKAQGKWEQAKDPTGKDLFYSKDENGNLDINGPLVSKDNPNCSEIPFMLWKGKFEEGAVLTLWSIMKDTYNKGSLKEALNDKFHNPNVDPEVVKTYQSNIASMITDMFMLLLVGLAAAAAMDWADDDFKEFKNSPNMDNALQATWSSFVGRTLSNSKNDFFWIKSIFEPSMDWNPFALSYMTKEASKLWDLAVGDSDFSKTVVNSFSAARQLRPIFECLSNEN